MKDPSEFWSNLNVAVLHDPTLEYPQQAPYNPSSRYPEYVIDDVSDGNNAVYAAVRNTLALLGFDKDSFGTSKWNPLKEIVKPGEKVVIKPNFVRNYHAKKEGELYSVITHPSIIRSLVDYVYLALEGKGRIIIADAPQAVCNFDDLLEKTCLISIKELYKRKLDFNIEIYDLRNFWLDTAGNPKSRSSRDRHRLKGDPSGSVLVNLGRKSMFYGMDNKEMYGADFNRNETKRHHHDEIQEYLVSKTILSADVVISVPKLKVHTRIGATLNLKNFVGMNTNKNYLVHYKLGSPSQGGDQYPDGEHSVKEEKSVKMKRWASDVFLSKYNPMTDYFYSLSVKIGEFFIRLKEDERKHHTYGGHWYGNDSTWRMVTDLLRIITYADDDGKLHEAPTRRMFCLVDGIIGGEGEGPLATDAKICGLLIAGFNPVAVDLACLRLMGFDYTKSNEYRHVVNHSDLFKRSPSEIEIKSDEAYSDLFNIGNKSKYFEFKPPSGWKHHIEIE